MGSTRHPLAVIGALAASLTLLAASPASASTTWSAVPTPGGDLSQLYGVAATAPDAAWAVGSAYDFSLGAQRSLIARWNGTSWSRVTSPNGSQLYNELYAVDATSASDAWAVGSIETAHGPNGGGDGPKKAAAWRWNGTSWRIVDLPKPANTPTVTGVEALSPGDAWAVGWYYESLTPTAVGAGYAAHWNGSTWKQVELPAVGDYLTQVYTVSGTSPTDVWAVGSWRDRGPGQPYHPLALHWDGSAWTPVTVPEPAGGGFLRGVKALSPTDVWAVGGRDYRTPISFHWNGTAWAEVPLPALGGTGNNFLYSVTGTGPGKVWAVGYTSAGTNNPEPLVERWNGSSWQIEPGTTTQYGGLLNSAAAVAGTNGSTTIWGAGYRNAFSGTGFTNRTLALRGSDSG
ncbi:hypothetical protein [Planotetraspora sp. GP83]|uniref:hypothetical protein n=1 Tax=Planotetraspora sp. GP83 TaxID=3156264 RepID=UPI00351712E1